MTKMITSTVKFEGLLLWLLFVVNFALGNPIKQDTKAPTMPNGDGFLGLTRPSFDHKELIYSSAATDVSIKQLQGRKLLVDNVEMNEIKKDNGVYSSLKSGKAKVSSKKDGIFSQNKLNGHDSSKGSHHQPPESKFMNMMHKDYNGFNNPRRKPPINNKEPLDDYKGPPRKPPNMLLRNNYEPLDVVGSQTSKPHTHHDKLFNADNVPTPKSSEIDNCEPLGDYNGPHQTPRKKPPINNHQPLDEDNGEP